VRLLPLERDSALRSRRVSHASGQGKYFDTEFNFNGVRREVVPGYYTHVVTDMAADWLARQDGGRPWCLMIGHKAPHSFYFPEPKYERSFDQVRIPYPETAFMLDDKPAWIKDRLYTWHGIYGPLFDWRKQFPDDSPGAVRDFEAMTRAYWGTLVSVDDSVGRLYALLRQRGELDNTIFVFMSDNGILNGEHGMVDNIEFDPGERYNLIRNPKYAGVVRELQQQLVELMAATGLTPETDRMPLDEGIKQELPEASIR
jgi:arylsulfatase A-like enzyme